MRQTLNSDFSSSAATVGRMVGWPRKAGRDAAYLIAVNLALQMPFWIAGHFYSFQRPLLNYDLAIALLGFCISAWIGWPLLCIALVIDVARIASLNYHFRDISDLVQSARFVGLLSLSGFISWGVAAALGCVVLYSGFVASWLKHWRRHLLVGQLLVLLALGALDSLNGSMQILGGGLDRLRAPVNVGGSPIWNLYSMHVAGGSGGATLSPIPSTVRKTIQDWHAAHPDRSVMLVVVESMGWPEAAAVQAWLASELQSEGVDVRWHLKQGEEPFRGSTTHGELRVLCGLDGPYELVSKSMAPACLPAQLNSDGFESVGYHGFQLAMFDRRNWWKTLGLKPHQFDYVGSAPQLKDCHNVFHGICDVEVLGEAVTHVQHARRFSYVMTLDTHLPLPSAASVVPAGIRALCTQEKLTVSACELVNQLGGTLRTLARLLAAGKRTPFVAVVGDHAPPFLGRDSRATFAPDKVPFFILEPR